MDCYRSFNVLYNLKPEEVSLQVIMNHNKYLYMVSEINLNLTPPKKLIHNVMSTNALNNRIFT